MDPIKIHTVKLTDESLRVDDFTRAYLECALWSSNDESDESGGTPLDRNYSIEDIAPESVAKAMAECEAFRDENSDDLDNASTLHVSREWSADQQNGHDFWLTRNGHGVGFWDLGYGALGDRLTDAAHKCGERNPYVGDDGLIYIEY